MAKLDFLNTSLKQLRGITNQAYNPDIRPVALAVWAKHLKPINPQWKYITAKPFYYSDKTDSAHVMAMIDKRLPNIGIVGYFACTNVATGVEVLNQATDWLKKKYGITDIYGPINGTLPSDYRLNLADDYRFPGEPVNPIWYIDTFREAGFNIFNRYVSGKLKNYQILLKFFNKKPAKKYSHLVVRPFDTHHQVEDFKIYHNLRNAIFSPQSIYCPAISLEERIYNSVGKFDPKYTFFLLDNGRAVGFIMGYEYDNKLILKTIGLLPEYRGQQLKGLLINQIRKQAKNDNLEACIFAMVRVGNAIYNKPTPGFNVFRKYVTMHKRV